VSRTPRAEIATAGASSAQEKLKRFAHSHRLEHEAGSYG
jgi:hypothetical protein